jgi:hypothetical protein
MKSFYFLFIFLLLCIIGCGNLSENSITIPFEHPDGFIGNWLLNDSATIHTTVFNYTNTYIFNSDSFCIEHGGYGGFVLYDSTFDTINHIVYRGYSGANIDVFPSSNKGTWGIIGDTIYLLYYTNNTPITYRYSFIFSSNLDTLLLKDPTSNTKILIKSN